MVARALPKVVVGHLVYVNFAGKVSAEKWPLDVLPGSTWMDHKGIVHRPILAKYGLSAGEYALSINTLMEKYPAPASGAV